MRRLKKKIQDNWLVPTATNLQFQNTLKVDDLWTNAALVMHYSQYIRKK